MSEMKKLDDYPPWIQAAAVEISDRYNPDWEMAEIIERHHEVCPHFLPPRPEDTARVLEHFKVREPLTKDWLISNGGKPDDNPLKLTFERGDSLPLGLWDVSDGWKVMLLIDGNFAAQVVRGLKTRGDFYRLAVALLPGKEGNDG